MAKFGQNYTPTLLVMCHLIGLTLIVSKVLVNLIPKVVAIMMFKNKVTTIIKHVAGSRAAKKSYAHIFLDTRKIPHALRQESLQKDYYVKNRI